MNSLDVEKSSVQRLRFNFIETGLLIFMLWICFCSIQQWAEEPVSDHHSLGSENYVPMLIHGDPH